MPNQHLPLPPDDEIEPHVRYYHSLGRGPAAMVKDLKRHYDTTKYGLQRSSVMKLCRKFGLRGTRKQAHTFETIREPIAELKEKFPKAGVVLLHDLLMKDYEMHVPKDLIMRFNREFDPHGVQARRGRRFRRKVFYAAGVNHIWALDQHDKWRRFGLHLHHCIEPFVGKLMWMVIWWTNSNPIYIAKHYFDAVRSSGGAPLVTQSDLGTENYNIAYGHTMIRQRLDSDLEGSLQHAWLGGHRNIKPEAAWSRLRFTWSPGFEDMLQRGLDDQLYNPDNLVDRLVFRWIAIPYLQRELDAYVYLHNSTTRRANRHKALPHGIPDIMFKHPDSVNALDFKVLVPNELLDEMESQYAPPNDPVFDLVPPMFGQLVSAAYASIGNPAVTFQSFWDVYTELREAVEHVEIPVETVQELDSHAQTFQNGGAGETTVLPPGPLFPPQQEFQFGQGSDPDLVGYDPSNADFEAEFSDEADAEATPVDILQVDAYFTDEDLEDFRGVGPSQPSIPAVDFTDDLNDELY